MSPSQLQFACGGESLSHAADRSLLVIMGRLGFVTILAEPSGFCWMTAQMHTPHTDDADYVNDEMTMLADEDGSIPRGPLRRYV
jgi:hypothetical protein